MFAFFQLSESELYLDMNKRYDMPEISFIKGMYLQCRTEKNLSWLMLPEGMKPSVCNSQACQ